MKCLVAMVTDSQRQERRGAKVYGGKVNSGSGNTDGFKNDVRTDDMSIEFKTTSNKSYSLRLDSLRTAEKEALRGGRESVLFGIDFRTPRQTFRYVVLTEEEYLWMQERLEEARADAANYRELYLEADSNSYEPPQGCWCGCS